MNNNKLINYTKNLRYEHNISFTEKNSETKIGIYSIFRIKMKRIRNTD